GAPIGGGPALAQFLAESDFARSIRGGTTAAAVADVDAAGAPGASGTAMQASGAPSMMRIMPEAPAPAAESLASLLPTLVNSALDALAGKEGDAASEHSQEIFVGMIPSVLTASAAPVGDRSPTPIDAKESDGDDIPFLKADP